MEIFLSDFIYLFIIYGGGNPRKILRGAHKLVIIRLFSYS